MSVIEVFQQTRFGYVTPTVRVGLDGRWVGANRGSSCLFFSGTPEMIDPAERMQKSGELLPGISQLESKASADWRGNRALAASTSQNSLGLESALFSIPLKF